MSKPIFATPDDAERAFYEALARSDLDTMMAVWAEDEEVVCVHPGGSRFSGLTAIREVWRQLFASGVKLRIRTSHPVKTHAMLIAVHCVLEHVSIEGEDTIAPPMIATNVYSRGAHGWQMIVHHTSAAPDTEGLLLQETPRIVH
ncbi:MAG TPA: nuclear transport factor 2 family protein [Rhodocyclaceae bacterium]|nr:nuclear transport factor 2 family protein [Rhodocyclaceae bacterium]